jgi:hypothetical protein
MEALYEEEYKNLSSGGSSPVDLTGLVFPTKPQARGMGQAVRVISNFYPIRVRDQRTTLHAYKV